MTVRYLAQPSHVEVLDDSCWRPARAFAMRATDGRREIYVQYDEPGRHQRGDHRGADAAAPGHWVDRDRVRIDNPPGHECRVDLDT